MFRQDAADLFSRYLAVLVARTAAIGGKSDAAGS
jgi:hypothetical protein